ncbi:MAG: 4-hydroxythreonine-4-phosphate dehydrogenase PdxA [Deltaproteobacteria bacterium]|nr:4-hydroxythreonine-4-phosphate dehydrogenase PdxA [Deltaproteobacteria bacterium]MDQ3298374.1 4-hydroxythreonine-4-phosphate dehydrogenase PdxA [Myxococcota bacterium]
MSVVTPGRRGRLGITLGDPAGIGPEIVAATLAALGDEDRSRITVYGDHGPLERGARAIGVTLPADVLIVGGGTGASAIAGKPDEQTGAAQVGYLEAAIAAARAGEVAALVTAPISKTWAARAGFAFPGHTELLAARLGADHVVMLFAGPRLKVALATIHIPLAEVARTLTTASLRRTIEILAASLVRDFAIALPRIGVVGLNPHAGEGGLLGTEDAAIIAPALTALPPAQLFGPLVADAVFRDAMHGKYDALVAMYHDQGLIPVKLVDFDEAVNVTLGLPIVRTSPDHGTAYDIAGSGTARPISMQRALSLAIDMLERRAS